MNDEQIKEFKNELKLLLEKYNVYIGLNFADCSDTHGMYDERIVIYSDSWRQQDEIVLTNGYTLYPSDL